MKNFFKKLSFVLAVAMVLTSITPATASAAGKTFIYKSGKVSELADGYMLWVGDKGTDLNVMVNGKKNVAGTWKVGNKAIATIDKNGVVTPKANGKTTVRFTAKTGETDTLKITVGTRASSVKPYVSTDTTKTTITELEMTVGESKDIWLSLPVPSAAKKAGSTSSTFVTDTKGYDEEVLTVKKNSTRKFTFTANKAGETTITIGAGKPSNKFVKTAEIKVTVVEKLAAKQTGANKITVTGADLSDKVADYTLKLGNATKNLASAEKQADGSVVLTAGASYFVDGDYTLKIGDATVELQCEASKTDSIVVYPESAVMTSTQSAVVYFKALNQWEENVTAKAQLAAAGTNVDSSKINKGILTFNLTGTEQYSLNLSQIAVNIMDKDNGVNYANVLTVSDYSKLKEVTIKGIYEVVGGVAKPATLKEDAVSADLTNIKILLSGVDQYGLPYDVASIKNSGAAANINLYVTGLTGLKIGAIDSTVVLNDVPYACVSLDVEASFGKLKGGEATVQGYVLTGTGTAVKETFTVGGSVKIASLTINATDVIYGGDTVDLSYEALDEDGNSITDIATLCKFNDQTRTSGALKTSNLVFVGSKDGKAKLRYTADDASSQTVASISWISDTNVYGYKTLTIMPNRKAVFVIGVWSTAERSARNGGAYLAATNGNDGSVTVRQLKYEDQYGNTIPYSDFNQCVSGSGIAIKVVTDLGDVPAVFNNLVTNAALGSFATVSSASASSRVVSFTSIASNASGSAIATVGLEAQATVNGTVRKSTCEFKIAAVAMKDTTVSAMFFNPNIYVTNTAISVFHAYNTAVSVKYGAFDVNATPNTDYKVQYEKSPVLNPAEVGQNATADGVATVWVDDTKGTVLDVPYTATNATTKVVSATVYSPYAGKSDFYYPGYYATTAAATIDVREFLDVSASAFDLTTAGLAARDARVTFTNIPEGAHVSNNGAAATVQFDQATGYDKYYTITATFTWDCGYSTTEVLCFKIAK